MERFVQTISIIKDVTLVSVIGFLVIQFSPLILNESLTADFEVSEINLLVVKLTPQSSERAIRAPSLPEKRAEPGEILPPPAGGGEPDASPTRPAAKPKPADEMVAYYSQQTQQSAPRRIAVPMDRIYGPGQDAEAKALHGWSYLGTYRDGEYSDLIFEIDDSSPPQALAGKTIKANTDVFVRDAKPVFLLGWIKGEPSGVLKEGASVEVLEVGEVPAKGGGVRVWIRT